MSRRRKFSPLEFFYVIANPIIRVPQKEVGKRSSITFFVFGTLSVTFRSLFRQLFSSLFCQTPFAGLLSRQSDINYTRKLCFPSEISWHAMDYMKSCHEPNPAVAIGPAPHRVSRALRARNPGRVRKESGKSTPGQGPQKCPKSAPRSLERVRNLTFGLFSDSFETPRRTLWALLGPCPGVLFPDSFRTLPGFRARRARETLCGAGPIATLRAWYSARILGVPLNHRCKSGVAPGVQETFSRLSGRPPKRLLAPSPIDVGGIQESRRCTRPTGSQPKNVFILAHQNRTIAIAGVDRAKSPEIPQKEGVLDSEIAARNRKSLATFHRILKSQCSIAFSSLGNRAISGVRDGHRNRKNRCDFGALKCLYVCHVFQGRGALQPLTFG